MHRDVVTHVAISSADFFITGSNDGKVRRCLSSVSSSFRCFCTSLRCLLPWSKCWWMIFICRSFEILEKKRLGCGVCEALPLSPRGYSVSCGISGFGASVKSVPFGFPLICIECHSSEN